MTRDHALIDELLAARALGGLDEENLALLDRELAAHGSCDECRRLEIEHVEVAGLLAYALDPRPVDDAMVDRILSRPGGPATAAAPVDEVSTRREARLGRWQAAFGVAAAIALVLAVVLATRPGGAPEEVVAGRFVRFDGPVGTLAMAYTPGEPGVVIWGTGLPDPGIGRVYELWMIQGDTPVRGACLTPTDGAVAAFVDADLAAIEQMAVTVEARTCPSAPTTDPVYAAELS
jgi:anti-sigma-K factor RskA